ncbi:PREDICTED: uncharacterized protein LOC109581617 [Amphimedon queenslandica]|nr:PREDICTED: uncharacterized protein LOC109581617 [Amphimedon queenslandica]|eukprot:XP_019851442.1 PREDICTED: uncharacterized protein LOC109581617 [Amphimedon queenslandica]
MDGGGCVSVSWSQERQDSEWRKRTYEQIRDSELLDIKSRPAKIFCLSSSSSNVPCTNVIKQSKTNRHTPVSIHQQQQQQSSSSSDQFSSITQHCVKCQSGYGGHLSHILEKN